MKERTSADVIVIGAGIAGASVAAELSKDARVLLLEMESQAGYHTTGRSAAVYAPIYGPKPIRAFTRASEAFFRNPPDGFTAHELFSPRSIMLMASESQMDSLAALLKEMRAEGPVERLDAQQTKEVQPLLREGYAAGAMLDRNGQDIDVHALHQGYLRQAKALGCEMISNAEVSAMQRVAKVWKLSCGDTSYEAPVVVNAAGAWADKVGQLAQAESIGLVPKRRTALIVAAPEGIDITHLPISIDIDEKFYLKPDAGRLLISPANEDPEEPCDVQPDEMDIALCVDRIERAFDLQVRRIENRWAGLRSFVNDKCPVAGFSAKAEGFYWLAGQGGYGIQSAPALARFAAAQIKRQSIPEDILSEGLHAAAVAPQRLS